MRQVSNKNVIAASMGNHAQGVAFAAGTFGKHARIVMPVTAPIVKQEAAKNYGGEVALYGESFSESLEYAMSQRDAHFIHAFDDDEVIAGQGTVGLEIMDDLKDIDAILVPVGGGGLISGVALAVKTLSPKIEIIGVQTRSAQAAYMSFREKAIVESPPSHTLADGIAVGKVGKRTFEIMERHVDDMLLVDEDSIAMSILLFLERKKLVAEGAGAVPLAALFQEGARFRGRRVVLLVSGGNIDFNLIDRIIHKGLLISGRLGMIEADVDDVPGRLNALTGIIAMHRGNILSVAHDRLSADLPIGVTKVVFVVETRGKDHLEEIISDMTAKGFAVKERGRGPAA